MGSIASQITSLTIVYSSVHSGADHRKHQSTASLAFVRGIHRRPVNSPHKGPVTRKMFPFHDVIIMAHMMWESGNLHRCSQTTDNQSPRSPNNMHCCARRLWKSLPCLGNGSWLKSDKLVLKGINSLHAESLWWNMKIYLPFLSFLDILMVQVVEIIPYVDDDKDFLHLKALVLV